MTQSVQPATTTLTNYDEQAFSQMLSEIEELTDVNAHGHALETIAKFFKYKKLESVFKHINALHELRGHLCQNLSALRNEFADQMFDCIYCEEPGNELVRRINHAL